MDFLRRLFGLPTRLERAVREGDREEVRRILDEGTTDWDGRTVGIAAVDQKAPHILEALLDAGVDPAPLLCHAARRGFADMVELLIRRGADVGCLAEALNLAVYSHHAAAPEMLSTIVDRLLSGGADVDAAWRGITALMAAADLGANQVVELLLFRGADVDRATDPGGFTPLFFAVMSNRVDVVRGLLAAGAKADARSDDGSTPLSRARRLLRGGEVEALLGAIPSTDDRVLEPVKLEALGASPLEIRVEYRGPGLAGKQSTLGALVQHYESRLAGAAALRVRHDEVKYDVRMTLGARLPDGRRARIVASAPTGAVAQEVGRNIRRKPRLSCSFSTRRRCAWRRTAS